MPSRQAHRPASNSHNSKGPAGTQRALQLGDSFPGDCNPVWLLRTPIPASSPRLPPRKHPANPCLRICPPGNPTYESPAPRRILPSQHSQMDGDHPTFRQGGSGSGVLTALGPGTYPVTEWSDLCCLPPSHSPDREKRPMETSCRRHPPAWEGLLSSSHRRSWVCLLLVHLQSLSSRLQVSR